MRVLLVHPTSFAGNDISHPRVEHLGLGYLAAVARRDGFEVRIEDYNIPKTSTPDAARHLISIAGDYDLVGFSVLGTSYPQAKALVTVLRASGFRGHVTMGGYFPTFLANSVFDELPEIDSILTGEAETTFPQLLHRLAGGDDWRTVPGLAFRDGAQVIQNGPPPLIANLDTLPFPARDTLATLLQYHNPVISVSPSRGCWATCNFCSIIEFYGRQEGRPMRERSPSNIVDEIEEVLARPEVRLQHVDFVWFCADEFLGLRKEGRRFGVRFAEEVLRRQVVFRWEMACRADQVEFENFRLLREAGLRSVYLGVESFSDRQLASYQKRTTADRNRTALDTLKRLRIDYTMGTIVFSKDTTLEEFEENHRAIKGYGYRHVTMPLSRLKLFEGTPATEQQRIKHDTVRAGDAHTAAVADDWFPLDDVFGYEFDDPRLLNLWEALRMRGERNDELVREVIALLDDRLLDGVAFWKLTFAIRDTLASRVDDAINAVRSSADPDSVRKQHERELDAAARQIAEFRQWLLANPDTGEVFRFRINGEEIVYRVPSRKGICLPGAEKDVAEREYLARTDDQPLMLP